MSVEAFVQSGDRAMLCYLMRRCTTGLCSSEFAAHAGGMLLKFLRRVGIFSARGKIYFVVTSNRGAGLEDYRMIALLLLASFIVGLVAGYGIRALRSHRRLLAYRRQQIYRRYVSDGFSTEPRLRTF